MAPIEIESNVNVLREYAVLATRENKRLQSIVDNLNEVLGGMNQQWLKDDGSNTNLEDHAFRRNFLVSVERALIIKIHAESAIPPSN